MAGGEKPPRVDPGFPKGGRRGGEVQEGGDVPPEASAAAGKAAGSAYLTAGDQWASAEYRAAVAETLVSRLARGMSTT